VLPRGLATGQEKKCRRKLFFSPSAGINGIQCVPI